MERDYSLGTIPRFETHFPQQLQGRVQPHPSSFFLNLIILFSNHLLIMLIIKLMFSPRRQVSHEEFEHTLSTINGFFFDSENLTAAQCLERY